MGPSIDSVWVYVYNSLVTLGWMGVVEWDPFQLFLKQSPPLSFELFLISSW
jgi:hypothetical protein